VIRGDQGDQAWVQVVGTNSKGITLHPEELGKMGAGTENLEPSTMRRPTTNRKSPPGGFGFSPVKKMTTLAVLLRAILLAVDWTWH
jgi:hypothetical protein